MDKCIQNSTDETTVETFFSLTFLPCTPFGKQRQMSPRLPRFSGDRGRGEREWSTPFVQMQDVDEISRRQRFLSSIYTTYALLGWLMACVLLFVSRTFLTI